MNFFKNVILTFSMYLHLLCEIITCFYVFIFKKTYDLYFLIYFLIVLILKLKFKNECIWSVLDKRLINKNYKIGSNPAYQPFREIYGNKFILNIIGLLILIEFFIIFFRNTNKLIKFIVILDFLLLIVVEFNINKIK